MENESCKYADVLQNTQVQEFPWEFHETFQWQTITSTFRNLVSGCPYNKSVAKF